MKRVKHTSDAQVCSAARMPAITQAHTERAPMHHACCVLRDRGRDRDR